MAVVTVTTSGADPRTYELNKPRFVLGRDPAADIHLDNGAVSKQHCEIVKEGDGFIARDLKSSNKTFVNGNEIQEHKLQNGDELVIGLFKIKFSGMTVTAPVAKPAGDEPFEPTIQLPPEMMRKKLEEMQREREQGVNAARAAAATAVKSPQSKPVAPATSVPQPSQEGSSSSSLAVIIIVAAIVLMILLNVIVALRNK